jgi:ABC-type uncharacterized transport system auxiliary subunit
MVRRLLAAALAALSLSGCSLGLTAPPVRYFEIVTSGAQPLAGRKLPPVAVPDFRSLSPYDHLRLVIRKSPVELEANRTLQWATLPGRMLAQGLAARLQGTDRFESVLHEGTPQPPYEIQGLVQAIELTTKPATAHLALRVTVRRSENGAVIDEQSVDETRPVKGRGAADGVLELRDMYNQVLDRLTPQIIDAIQRDVQQASSRSTGASQ